MKSQLRLVTLTILLIIAAGALVTYIAQNIIFAP